MEQKYIIFINRFWKWAIFKHMIIEMQLMCLTDLSKFTDMFEVLHTGSDVTTTICGAMKCT